jgi:hypothetical protein
MSRAHGRRVSGNILALFGAGKTVENASSRCTEYVFLVVIQQE